ncbi:MULTISPECIES: phosphate ABC transporter permease PstA [Exiguobacterium]|uniref:Phosphate transport system permease protein PstA n=1 Tax=Exiguobacterium sibiricum (strain DSM 17290 / CCUG 55495 / CIP 109462 / JCM 13490 / 255-15) TaxID=262543 RepID=B1YLB0_EXIS2|nr:MULTISPECIES: phosphate ABC transporter permease PstA [Exiguobacterium]ACB60342.1 phosphate ABC transporter, inner membrane subunit PstA [Exiguobacterium sibiricum 255-15]MCT4792587.1 phosphate ABC transporter permease PstA [Exiguobacterium artemiae]MDW2885589.1 phosphate ABC transporter permease PstA [Exiguobacterium sibiricum]MDX1259855.1 phosphate ABC transporter permease PstA [Exiguobacterium sp. K1]HCN58897.1 phosphate ABC transporter permease PtsA [Exiguobacterium sp.]
MALPEKQPVQKKFIDPAAVKKSISQRLVVNNVTKVVFLIGLLFGLVVLGILLFGVIRDGAAWLSLDFLQNAPSRRPDRAGIYPALMGSIFLMLLIIPMIFILGVGAAIYLEEYAKKGRMTSFIEVNISNLAGVPSIVFGLLGLTFFVRNMGFGSTLIAGALTLALMSLPVVIVSSQEAIRAVPQAMRHASLALGASKWQTTFKVVLPASLPGVITGIILAVSRAIGETAPLIMVGAAIFIARAPEGIFSEFTALPIQIYNWTSRPQADFQGLAAAGIIILMVILLTMNSLAIWIRNRFSKRY